MHKTTDPGPSRPDPCPPCKTCWALKTALFTLKQELQTKNTELETLRADAFQTVQELGVFVNKVAGLEGLFEECEEEHRVLEVANGEEKAELVRENEGLKRRIDGVKALAEARIAELEERRQREKEMGGEKAVERKWVEDLREEVVRKGKVGRVTRAGLDKDEEMDEGTHEDMDIPTPSMLWKELWRGVTDLLLRFLGRCDKS
jgi:hypothetical protein